MMVRLEDRIISEVNAPVLDFNSMMVRLEVDYTIVNKDRINIFQFHDGAIGRFIKMAITQNPLIFQFHDGAIGSASFIRLRCACCDFNSMMVRLEVLQNDAFDAGKTNFNSMMVRLEADVESSRKILVRIFQFHDGAIGRLRLI